MAKTREIVVVVVVVVGGLCVCVRAIGGKVAEIYGK